MKDFLLKLVKDLVFFLLLIFLLGFSLWGLKPTEIARGAQISYFRLSPFSIGLALYQQDRPFFYNFTPYNDYFFDQAGIRSALITKRDILDENFKNDLKRGSIQEKYLYLKRLLKLNQPSIAFKNNDLQVKYQAQVKGQEILLKREIFNFPQINQAERLAMTISYDKGDFVFDESFTLYTEKPTEEIDLLGKIYGLFLRPARVGEEKEEVFSGEWQEVTGQRIFLLNPSLPGLILVKAQNDQTVLLNRLHHFLAVEEKIDIEGGTTENFLTLEILGSPQEVLEKRWL